MLEGCQRNPQGRGRDTRIDSWLQANGKESGLEKGRKYLENRVTKVVWNMVFKLGGIYTDNP